jgi:hypothetical protein
MIGDQVIKKGLVDRVTAILLRPKLEWPVIAAEAETVGSLYSRYIFIMAAIPAVMSFIKMSVIGIGLPFMGTMRLGVGVGLTGLVTNYVLSLVGVFLVALLVDALAPSFGGQKNRVQALKTVAYAYTASWVASIGQIIPGLWILIMLAGLVYGIYLLYVGLPVTMKCPPDKAAGYTAVTIIVALILSWAIGMLVGAATGFGGMMAGMGGAARGGYASDAGGDVTFDPNSPLGKLAAMGKQAEAASKQMEAAQKSGDANAQADAAKAMVAATLGGGAKVEALAPDRLKAFVPDSLGGMKRADLSVDRNGAMGMQISKANARYADDAGHFVRLEVTDLGSAKGLMALAGFAGAEQDSETDHGYDKTYRSGDQWIHEKWDSSGKTGEYGVIVGGRFSVSAEGAAASIDELKSDVASVNLAGLESLKDDGVQKLN